MTSWRQLWTHLWAFFESKHSEGGVVGNLRLFSSKRHTVALSLWQLQEKNTQTLNHTNKNTQSTLPSSPGLPQKAPHSRLNRSSWPERGACGCWRSRDKQRATVKWTVVERQVAQCVESGTCQHVNDICSCHNPLTPFPGGYFIFKPSPQIGEKKGKTKQRDIEVVFLTFSTCSSSSSVRNSRTSFCSFNSSIWKCSLLASSSFDCDCATNNTCRHNNNKLCTSGRPASDLLWFQGHE